MRNELCGAGRERGRIYSDIDGCGRSKTRSKIVQVTGKTKPGVDFTRLSVHKGWGPDVHILSFSDREMRLPKVFRTAAMPFQQGVRRLFVCGQAMFRHPADVSVTAVKGAVRTGGMRHVLWVINSGFPDHRPVRDRSARNCFARGIDPGKPGSCSSPVGRRCVRGGSLPATDSRPCAIRAAGPAVFPSL